MIPMRHSSIFKSRWMALLWAAGVLWLAYDVASSAREQEDLASENQAGSDTFTAKDVQDFQDSINSL
jgi:hypothetical protein